MSPSKASRFPLWIRKNKESKLNQKYSQIPSNEVKKFDDNIAELDDSTHDVVYIDTKKLLEEGSESKVWLSHRTKALLIAWSTMALAVLSGSSIGKNQF